MLSKKDITDIQNYEWWCRRHGKTAYTESSWREYMKAKRKLWKPSKSVSKLLNEVYGGKK